MSLLFVLIALRRLNAIREISLRCPLAMTDTLLHDLSQYKGGKDKVDKARFFPLFFFFCFAHVVLMAYCFPYRAFAWLRAR